MTQKIFENKKAVFRKLLAFGFTKSGADYVYKTHLLDGQFCLKISVSNEGEITTKVTELPTEEPYTLHLLEGANGPFVGRVKEEYEKILQEIGEKCFEIDVFKSDYTKNVLEFVRLEYGDEPEYLWEKFPDNAVLRRKDTSKWYAAILTVAKNKLGLTGSEKIEVIDLRILPDELQALIDNKKYFPGYHMNKKHWLTIILDGSVPLEEIYSRIKDSYKLAV